PRCGNPVGGDLQGLCPKCMLAAGLNSSSAEPADKTTTAGPSQDQPCAVAPVPEPGQNFGKYHLVRYLGKGGMGTVFEAEELEAGRRLALKVLAHSLDSPEARQRFLREGRLAASVNHPNSVYVFGTEEVGDTPVIAMELVQGGTLQNRVREKGPMPITEAVD